MPGEVDDQRSDRSQEEQLLYSLYVTECSVNGSGEHVADANQQSGPKARAQEISGEKTQESPLSVSAQITGGVADAIEEPHYRQGQWTESIDHSSGASQQVLGSFADPAWLRHTPTEPEHQDVRCDESGNCNQESFRSAEQAQVHKQTRNEQANVTFQDAGEEQTEKSVVSE